MSRIPSLVARRLVGRDAEQAQLRGALLVISDKTVSVHVSNILRKTGTSSRLEAAELARRSTTPTG